MDLKLTRVVKLKAEVKQSRLVDLVKSCVATGSNNCREERESDSDRIKISLKRRHEIMLNLYVVSNRWKDSILEMVSGW